MLREIFFGMLLILFVVTAGVGAMENPNDALPMAYKHPNAIVYTLASDRTTYSFGDEIYIKISGQNVSKETVYIWQSQVTLGTGLKFLSQDGTPLPAGFGDRPMTSDMRHPIGVSPGATIIDYGTHGETLIPVSQWGFQHVPRGIYFLTYEHVYGLNTIVKSNTIKITVK